jgi:putative PEP-CTERM system histidine kinase
MAFPSWLSLAAVLVAAMAGVMACVLLFRRNADAWHRKLAAFLAASAGANLANGIGSFDESHALFWREVATAAELIQPAALLSVGLAFLKPGEKEWSDSAALWRTRIIWVLGLLLSCGVVTGQFFQLKLFENGQTGFALSSWGHVPYVFMVIGMALGLAQLELVLRESREPMRHRLKFILIGLGGLAGYQIYQASQILLFQVWQEDYVLVGTVVTAMSLALIAYGVGRSRFQSLFVNAYVSQQALFGSMTFIVVGLYLLTVGIVGEWFRRTNESLGIGLSVVLVFGSLVGLAIAAYSKTVRAEIRSFLNRNFYRSKYDYRAQWLQVTEAFQHAVDKDAIMDSLLDLLIKTFPTRVISVWYFREADRRFFQARSMTFESDLAPLELSHPVVVKLSQQDDPVFLNEIFQENGAEGRSSKDSLTASGVTLCFPIRAQGQLRAFIALGRPLHAESYETDDCDLLRGVAHHVGVLLAHAGLAEERRASAELEALHRFSVFCLHDLKNLAARLSLVAQNAESHGRDPAFQESAMRTVTDTAKKMTGLLSKLSFKSLKLGLAGASESVHLSPLIEEIVASIKGEKNVRLHVTDGPVEPVLAVRDQIHQVLLNVILNAKQAVGEDGNITVAISQIDTTAVITVNDTGKGIPAGMLETLFQPAHSSRPGGLGIGLYQCKQIVEAHHGTIQVRSEVGKGTEVRIELPLAKASDARKRKLSAAQSVAFR